MTCDLKKLSKLHDVHLILVKMSNGQSYVARKQGVAKLNPNIILYDVLFVPGLTCNLMSIALLINDSACTVTFTPKLYVICELSLSRRIEVGRQRREVYLFNSTAPEEAKVNQMEGCDVWHQTLGHPSKGVAREKF